ncbi:response regulator [Paragemmobacter ruber]|uniref:Response regulator n=1 Tax=Paragemmobacter ruber TaxID=1985673 RepID=A0ABW9Y871_9RHOB|nr:response regulator [Rhodobacter ruber]NBE08047.1 response regulator [Rhodobacter ruber]
MKIFAVDDDDVFSEILRQKLRLIGYGDVTCLQDPLAAQQVLAEAAEAFDCILLDIEMPGLNGVELCGRIRALPAYRHTPIIMITSLAGRQSIDMAFQNGATDYITKPIDTLELKARLHGVERLLDERKRLQMLEYQISLQTDVVPLDFAFDQPILVPEFDRGIEFHALQNYLLTLGLKGLYSVSAVAICIENAVLTYRIASRVAFRNMLADVGSVIEDCLKTESLLIAYAGSGNFVGIVTGTADWVPADLEFEMNAKMEEFSPIYVSERLPLPRIRVGPMVSNSLLSLARPSQVLDRAIVAAGSRSGLPRMGIA